MVNLKPTTDSAKQAVMYPLHGGHEFSRKESSQDPRLNRGVFPLERSSHGGNVEAEKVKLRKAAEGFEAIFLRKLFSTMRTTMSDNSMFGSGISGEIYGDIIDTAVADVLAEKNVLGFADMLYRSLVKSMETVQKPDSGGKQQ